MHETNKIPPWHTITTHTPDTIAKLGYDSQLQDALSLMRQNIWDLKDMNGTESTEFQKDKYRLNVRITPKRKLIRTYFDHWKQLEKVGRQPFLMIDSNITDGVIGVLEGRVYTFAPTGDKSIFVNWVVVRDSGTNDDDHYSYRGQSVGTNLYARVEELANTQQVTLLIAGVHTENRRSARFHEKNGFNVESFSDIPAADGSTYAHRTENGAYIPPYEVHGINSNNQPIYGAIEFYTKRLQQLT